MADQMVRFDGVPVGTAERSKNGVGHICERRGDVATGQQQRHDVVFLRQPLDDVVGEDRCAGSRGLVRDDEDRFALRIDAAAIESERSRKACRATAFLPARSDVVQQQTLERAPEIRITLIIVTRIELGRRRKSHALAHDHIVQRGIEVADIAGTRQIVFAIEQAASAHDLRNVLGVGELQVDGITCGPQREECHRRLIVQPHTGKIGLQPFELDAEPRIDFGRDIGENVITERVRTLRPEKPQDLVLH